MSFAACQIVVPSGPVTSWPSIVRLTVLISVGAGVEMATGFLGFLALGPGGTYEKGTGFYGLTGRVPRAADPPSDSLGADQTCPGRGSRSTPGSWHPGARE